jgi:hypothetical protein
MQGCLVLAETDPQLVVAVFEKRIKKTGSEFVAV